MALIGSAIQPKPQSVSLTTTGLLQSFYGEVTSVATSTLTTIVTHTVPVGKTFSLQFIEYNGGNIAKFTVEIDSVVEATHNTYFSGPMNGKIDFVDAQSKGLSLATGQVVRLRVIHGRTDTADFHGRIVGIEE